MGARQLLVAAADGGLILLQLLLEFRNFQYCQDLSLLYMSSVVDVEFLNVAGNFCVHIDFMKRLEFRSDLEAIRNVAAHHFHDGGSGSFRRIICGRLASLATPGESGGTNQEHQEIKS